MDTVGPVDDLEPVEPPPPAAVPTVVPVETGDGPILSTAAPVVGADPVVLLLASDDPAVLRERVLKYQKVTAKLKEILSAREAELKTRSAELAALKPFADQMASSLLGVDPQGIVATAKVAIGTLLGATKTDAGTVNAVAASDDGSPAEATASGGGGGRVPVPWCCLSSPAGDRHEWHPLDVVVSRHASLAPALQVGQGGRGRRWPPIS